VSANQHLPDTCDAATLTAVASFYDTEYRRLLDWSERERIIHDFKPHGESSSALKLCGKLEVFAQEACWLRGEASRLTKLRPPKRALKRIAP